MANYTAIYSTENLKNIEYAFKAENLEAAKQFIDWKFMKNDFIIRNDDNGEEVEYSNK